MAVIALSLLSACGPPSGPPAADSCNGASSDGVTSLSIGPSKERDAVYRPFSDGEQAPLVSGGQGARMLVVRLAVAGPNPPSCLTQFTQVSGVQSDGSSIGLGHDAVPRKTYAQPDGSRVTDDLYVVLDYFSSPSMAVSATVGALSDTRHLGAPPPDLSVPVDLAPADLGHD